MNVGLKHVYTRPVLIPLIQLSTVAKLKRESDYNLSFVQNSCRPREMKVSHQYIYIYIYVCMFVERVTEVTVNEQEDTSKKLTTKYCISEEECHIDVVHSFLWFDDFMDEIVIKPSRNRFLTADEVPKRWTTTELCIVQRIRRWRLWTEWWFRNESDRSRQFIGL